MGVHIRMITLCALFGALSILNTVYLVWLLKLKEK